MKMAQVTTLVILAFFFGNAAGAIPVPLGPSASSTGTYEIQYQSPPVGNDCYETALQEKVGNGGSWQTLSDADQDYRIPFSGKSSGYYYYRLRATCQQTGGGDPYAAETLSMSITETALTCLSCVDALTIPTIEFSDIHAVLVSLPVPVSDFPTTEEQLAYTYSAWIIDASADGLPDILVQRTSGGDLTNGALGHFVLESSSSGGFSSRAALTSDIALSAGISDVELRLTRGDFNADGAIDLYIGNISNAVANTIGVVDSYDDQIVYAPDERFAANPLGNLGVSSGLIDTMHDLTGFAENERFFLDRQVRITYGYWVTYEECELLEPGQYGDSWEWVCVTYEEYEEIEYFEYPGVSQDAVSLWEVFEKIDQGIAGYSDVVAELGRIFGVPIGDIDDCRENEIDFLLPNENDPIEICLGVAADVAVRSVARAIAAEDNDADNIYIGRPPGKIYVTARSALGSPYRHLSVEYRPVSIPGVSTADYLSAFPDRVPNLDYRRLVSARRAADDAPSKMHLVGELVPILGRSTASLWEDLVKSDTDYRDCLRYATLPSDAAYVALPVYNSNSWVIGLLAKNRHSITHTGVYDSIFASLRFPGTEKPVPAIEFSTEAPECY